MVRGVVTSLHGRDKNNKLKSIGDSDELSSINIFPLFQHRHVREMSICKLLANILIVFSPLLHQTGCAVSHCYDCNNIAYTRLGCSTNVTSQ